MNQQDLKNGKFFTFQGENDIAEISFGKTLGGYEAFKVWFNGAYILIAKTFKPIEKKVSKLKVKYNLIEQL